MKSREESRSSPSEPAPRWQRAAGRAYTGICCCLVALAAAPAAALAQDKPPPARAEARRAEELAGQAFALHGRGEYAQAISAYLEAYKLLPAGAILFNLANIHDRKLREGRIAADYYRRYLAAPDTEPGLVRRARERLAALEAEATPPPKPPPPPPAAAPPAPPAATSPLRTAGLVTGGIGLAAVLTGAVSGLVAVVKNNQAARYCVGVDCYDGKALTLTSEARTSATVSTSTFVTGGALLASGVVLLLVAPRSTRSTGLWITPQVSPGAAGLVLGRSF